MKYNIIYVYGYDNIILISLLMHQHTAEEQGKGREGESEKKKANMTREWRSGDVVPSAHQIHACVA